MKTRIIMILLIVFSLSSYAQEMQVRGKVVDELGDELPGVSVMVKGTKTGTSTNQYGDYAIKVEKGKILVFSFVGMQTKEVKVDREIINVTLEEDAVILSDVVVSYALADKASYSRKSKSKPESNSSRSLQYSSNSLSSSELSRPHVAASLSIISENEEYKGFSDNDFKSPLKDALSTFSTDVDVAAYSNMRRMLNQGYIPNMDAIRTEELINYFDYNYPAPTGSNPINISTEIGDCPWNKKHRLVKIGLKAKDIDRDNLPPSNLVFLIDVSGSMSGSTRIDLVKSSMRLLVNTLRPEDKVSIVTYANGIDVRLESTAGTDKEKILAIIDGLVASGGTRGGDAILLAYKQAKQNFNKEGNNRIILCTDGDFNIGPSNADELEKLIEKERDSGVFLSILGYGMGNYKDAKMQALAQAGNGNHAYIDNIQEANKVLVKEFGSTLHTIAKDVKLQLEFNPSKVQAYRLIGYETRLLNDEDFNDDKKDAGDIGVGHTVTAMYEVVPAGVESDVFNIDPLKYQKEVDRIQGDDNKFPDLLTIKLRYKEVDSYKSQLIQKVVLDDGGNKVSSDFKFAASVVMFSQLLRDSKFKGNSTYEDVISLAKGNYAEDEDGFKREFVRLVEVAKGLQK